MILSVILYLTAAKQELPDVDLLKPDPSILCGFMLSKTRTKVAHMVYYSRERDNSRLDIVAMRTDDKLSIEEIWNEANTFLISKYAPDRPQTPRSGLPLANRCADSRGPDGGFLYFMTGRLVLYVRLTGISVTETDYQLQEGAARYAVAKIRGLDTRAAGDATVYGHRVSGCRTGPSGDVLLPLDGWAAAAGVEITWNKVRGTASFNYSGLDYVFPLGSTKLKKGSEWQDCPDTLLWHGGHWYVPLRLVSK
ncbi:MAG: hypothetical protein JNM34_00210 [Chthonomonadaceae bacterium]|nr:hypothetical protein [Chthonomonadaceae bacterium]